MMISFQKVNFLRDIRSDFEERGRVYFPGVKFETFSETDKKSIEKDIAKVTVCGIRLQDITLLLLYIPPVEIWI